MPKLGLTMTEGVLTQWCVKPGDIVKPGDALFIVETEKIANEVEATHGGKIGALLAKEGDVLPVGAEVAAWADDDQRFQGDQPQPVMIGAAQVVQPAAQDARPVRAEGLRGQAEKRIIATPLARRMAKIRGLDLSAVTGSGPRGRIKSRDIEMFRHHNHPPAQHAGVPLQNRRAATSMEKTIARRMSESKRDIPHFYAMAEVDVTDALGLRAELNSDNSRPRISLTHMLVLAVSRVLSGQPNMLNVWANDEIVTCEASNIGMAVDTPRGLMAPVLRGVLDLGLEGVAVASADLIERTRAGRLVAADLDGAPLTVSNVGMHGGTLLFPIINPGQSSILGIAAPRQIFRPDAAGAPVLRTELGVVIACDHRVLDGVKAARFLESFAAMLRHPARLLRTHSPHH